jgi:hypothetical protein
MLSAISNTTIQTMPTLFVALWFGDNERALANMGELHRYPVNFHGIAFRSSTHGSYHTQWPRSRTRLVLELAAY